MHKILRKISLRAFLFTLILTQLIACSSVPGTFLNNEKNNNAYVIQNKTVFPKLIKVDADWISKQSHKYNYHIGPYDILNIIDWDHPELTTPTTQLSSPEDSGVLVSSDGGITFPFTGKLTVIGLTAQQIQLLLQQKLKKYIRDPQITVRVIAFRSKEIHVLGEVGKQGAVPITDKKLTLFDAISQAGGVLLNSANTQEIFIVRGNLKNLKILVFNAKSPAAMIIGQQFILENNDIVYVPPAKISGWNRVISQLLPTLGAVESAKNISK